MTDMWIRTPNQDDVALVTEWITENKKNDFDPEVIGYPQTKTFVASKDGAVAFQPVQIVPMLESFAPKPGLSKQDAAKALELFVKTVMLLAMQGGMGEVYFMSKDPDSIEFAKAHGFQDMSAEGFTTLRMKVSKIK